MDLSSSRGRFCWRRGVTMKPVRKDSRALGILLVVGHAYATKSWNADAFREFQRAQKLIPDSLPIATDLGRAAIQIGAWNDAEAQAALILGKEPQNREGRYIRATALLGQGKNQEALAVLEAL